jgi:hypothetical protein
MISLQIDDEQASRSGLSSSLLVRFEQGVLAMGSYCNLGGRVSTANTIWSAATHRRFGIAQAIAKGGK